MKTPGISVLNLPGTQDMTIVQTGAVRIECTFAESLKVSIVLPSLNQILVFWDVTPDGSVLLDLAR